MKKIFPLLIVALALGCLPSCDWIRSTLGMPTSAEIKERQAQMTSDSLERAARVLEEQQRRQFLAESLSREQLKQTSLKRYHVVMGSFRLEGNAQRMLNTLPKFGYTPQRLDFANGYAVISAYQTDTLSRAYKVMHTLYDLDITPYDIWIYDSKQSLHK